MAVLPGKAPRRGRARGASSSSSSSSWGAVADPEMGQRRGSGAAKGGGSWSWKLISIVVLAGVALLWASAHMLLMIQPTCQEQLEAAERRAAELQGQLAVAQ
eukprot:CAMPEP_0203886658 /NCGR_PEP_ID=MMETSP0359-20131031/30436_1 /ASSEMBLY_ACC=CAM_ASM_000338 /TAXON_ID=268821 /ORGANISM="Scrippsiella Hangoei, Strain SHTV-5" /LENGTH=101 /DNA_ID=CAMNT_0050807527 /DNA_START=19 /DNA_END=321 /DNA_ORIENTATION=+